MKKTSAFTLIETMIALVISVIAAGAMYSSYLFFNSSYQTILDKVQVNERGRTAIPMITKDLRNAGYKNVNYPGNLSNKIEHKDNTSTSDEISIWYTPSASSEKKITYLVRQYSASSDSSLNYTYLARKIDNGSPREIVSHVEDFQVILKDKQGRTLSPVCSACSQKGKDNQNEVHTAEVYITIKSPNKINKEKRKYIIANANRTVRKEDRHHRETFFISVYLRNIKKI